MDAHGIKHVHIQMVFVNVVSFFVSLFQLNLMSLLTSFNGNVKMFILFYVFEREFVFFSSLHRLWAIFVRWDFCFVSQLVFFFVVNIQFVNAFLKRKSGIICNKYSHYGLKWTTAVAIFLDLMAPSYSLYTNDECLFLTFLLLLLCRTCT